MCLTMSRHSGEDLINFFERYQVLTLVRNTVFKINDKFQLQFFRRDTRQEATNLIVSQDGAECRRLRQNSKGRRLRRNVFSFVCKRLPPGEKEECFWHEYCNEMYRTRQTVNLRGSRFASCATVGKRKGCTAALAKPQTQSIND